MTSTTSRLSTVHSSFVTTKLMDNLLKTQAIAEALDFYIYRLKEDNANQAAIDLFTQILEEVDPNYDYT